MGTYAVYSKVTKKKKKKVKTKNGKTREINCDVLVDPNGNELPGQQFDESGRCINEEDVLSRAANSGQIPPPDQPQQYGSGAPQQYGSQPQYGAPPMNQGYGAPPMQNNFGAPPMQPVYGAPPMQNNFGAPPMQPNFGAPPQNNFGAPPMGNPYGG